jgi:hypothetical protein
VTAGVPSVLATFWTGILAVLLACAVIAAAALLNSDRIRAWLAVPPVDLDAEDMPRQTWDALTEAEARAAHPAGRDLSPAPAAGKVECGSCTIVHDLTQVQVTFLGVTPVGGLLEQWACPECGWSNVIPAAQGRPVRGEL